MGGVEDGLWEGNGQVKIHATVTEELDRNYLVKCPGDELNLPVPGVVPGIGEPVVGEDDLDSN